MSAFVVSDTTINKIVSWLYQEPTNAVTWGGCQDILARHGYDIKTEQEARRLANDLFALNVRAVDERYWGGAQRFRTLDFEYVFMTPKSAIETVKALGCLMYQCAEGTVPETDLYKLMEEIINAMCRGIVMDSKEYQEAPWSH